MPPGVPMLATTATVTVRMREYIIEKVDMGGCFIVSESSNKPIICYEVIRKKTIVEDFDCIIRDVEANKVKAQRVVVYCQSLDMCASLYAHFLHVLQDSIATILQMLNTSVTTVYLPCSTLVLMNTTRGWLCPA